MHSHHTASPAATAATAATPAVDDIALLRTALGTGVAPATLRALAEAARLVRWPAGPLQLDSPRRPEPAWWLVRHGQVALCWNGDDSGAPKRLLAPGQWLDIAGALSAPGTWLDGAVCRTHVELLALPLPALLAAGAADPVLAQALLRLLAEQVRTLNRQIDELAHADVPVRLARWLLRRIGPQPQAGGAVRLVLGEQKQAIARQLSTTSETLSRTLRRLSDQGVLQVHHYEVTVRDMAALRALGQAKGGRHAAM